jgi:hypothetical protein
MTFPELLITRVIGVLPRRKVEARLSDGQHLVAVADLPRVAISARTLMLDLDFEFVVFLSHRHAAPPFHNS